MSCQAGSSLLFRDVVANRRPPAISQNAGRPASVRQIETNDVGAGGRFLYNRFELRGLHLFVLAIIVVYTAVLGRAGQAETVEIPGRLVVVGDHVGHHLGPFGVGQPNPVLIVEAGIIGGDQNSVGLFEGIAVSPVAPGDVPFDSRVGFGPARHKSTGALPRDVTCAGDQALLELETIAGAIQNAAITHLKTTAGDLHRRSFPAPHVYRDQLALLHVLKHNGRRAEQPPLVFTQDRQVADGRGLGFPDDEQGIGLIRLGRVQDRTQSATGQRHAGGHHQRLL